MAKGVNKVILIGNIGLDPEVRYLPSGSAVATLSVATTETWKDKQTGERQERTEWHRVALFNRLGEIAGEYLKKGAKVYIEGSLRTRKWQDKAGQDRYTTEIVATDLQMLDSRGAGSGMPDQEARSPARATKSQPSNSYENAGHDYPEHMPHAAGADVGFDDDIPF